MGEGKVSHENIAKRAETYKPKERVVNIIVHITYITEVKRNLGFRRTMLLM